MIVSFYKDYDKLKAKIQREFNKLIEDVSIYCFDVKMRKSINVDKLDEFLTLKKEEYVLNY